MAVNFVNRPRSEVLFGASSFEEREQEDSREAAAAGESSSSPFFVDEEINQSETERSEEDTKVENEQSQMVGDKETTASPPSPTESISALEAGNLSDNLNLSEDYQASLRKTGRFRCKSCNHQATTKAEFWQHLRGHLPPEKVLECPHCPFVTEYKHHLKYHLSNHIGIKPYKCPHCTYRCINRAMLNSHMRSHSADHSYECSDCPFQAKFLHNLRLHMRRFGHGNPADQQMMEEQVFPKPPPLHAPPTTTSAGPSPMPQLQPKCTPNLAQYPTPPLSQGPAVSNASQCNAMDPRILANSDTFSNVMRFLKPQENDEIRRQLPVFGSHMPLFVQGIPNPGMMNQVSPGLECEFCGILFRDLILYTVHSGYHTIDNPYRCNRCGYQAEDRVSFTVHLYRSSHS